MSVPERLAIRRVLTQSPLARQHDRTLTGTLTRTPAKIPWSSFDRARYPEPALALACKAQTMLATGEYQAVELFSRLAAGLALNGAPIDLVASAARAATDEIRHADYAFRFAALCGGKDDVAIEVRPKRTEKRWGMALDLESIDFMMVEIAAIGEALACALIRASRERASDVVARPLFTSILGDEVHHTRIGWYYLEWRGPQWTRVERQRVADHAGRMIVDIERRFWWGRDAPRGSQVAARALGLLESEGQRAVIARIMEDEVIPALDQLGLGASHAWRVRKRGGGDGVRPRQGSRRGSSSRAIPASNIAG
jgi:hypothetical protein